MNLTRSSLTTALILATLLVPLVTGLPDSLDAPGLGPDAASYVVVEAPVPKEQGAALVAFVRDAAPGAGSTPVLEINDPDGALVMGAWVQDRRLWITDGYDDEGEIRVRSVPGTIIEPHHHLYQVLLDGDTYTLTIDQEATTTARTFLAATDGRFGPLTAQVVDQARSCSCAALDAEVSETRWTTGSLARLHTFTSAPEAQGWEVVDASGDVVAVRPTGFGDRSRGVLDILGRYPSDVGYVHTDLSGFDGRYIVDASAGPANPLFMPASQTVVAGVSGPADNPSVQWAVVVDHIMPVVEETVYPDEWTFYFIGPDGSRTPIGGNWFGTPFHRVRVVVDETVDRVDVVVDGADEAFRFEGLGFGTSTAVATGDLDDGPALPVKGVDVARIRFDNLAVYPPAGQA